MELNRHTKNSQSRVGGQIFQTVGESESCIPVRFIRSKCTARNHSTLAWGFSTGHTNSGPCWQSSFCFQTVLRCVEKTRSQSMCRFGLHFYFKLIFVHLWCRQNLLFTFFFCQYIIIINMTPTGLCFSNLSLSSSLKKEGSKVNYLSAPGLPSTIWDLFILFKKFLTFFQLLL